MTKNNFANLLGQSPVIDESLESFEHTFVGFGNGDGGILTMVMHPFNGTRSKKTMRIVRLKEQRKVALELANASETDVELSEDEEIEKMLVDADMRTAMILSGCIDSWNLMQDGEPVEFSRENAQAMLFEVESIRVETDREMTKRGKTVTEIETA